MSQIIGSKTIFYLIIPSCDQKYMSVCPDLLVLHK